eukprot:1715731-Heterocapsa_arctica.AAC.1
MNAPPAAAGDRGHARLGPVAAGRREPPGVVPAPEADHAGLVDHTSGVPCESKVALNLDLIRHPRPVAEHELRGVEGVVGVKVLHGVVPGRVVQLVVLEGAAVPVVRQLELLGEDVGAVDAL